MLQHKQKFPGTYRHFMRFMAPWHFSKCWAMGPLAFLQNCRFGPKQCQTSWTQCAIHVITTIKNRNFYF